MHHNPYLATRRCTLKSQTAQLKRTLEELPALVEELQPEHTAMDWATSAATAIHVPVPTTRDDEPPRMDPVHPEVKAQEGVTFHDMSQY